MSAPADRLALGWSDIEALCDRLAQALARRPIDAILAVARGGLVPASLVAYRLGMRDVLGAAVASYDDEARGDALVFLAFPPDALISGRRVAIVDDVWDTGRTAVAVRERVRQAGGEPIVAVLHHKPASSSDPDDGPDLAVETTGDWIDYPWERFGRGGSSGGVL